MEATDRPAGDSADGDGVESRPVTAAIEVEQLEVQRGGRPVLHRVSLTVPPGRITGLLGPSGCGKTTLMRTIVGVQRVRSGTVRVLGLPAGTRALRARVGYVTQAPAIYRDLTVHENLRYFARIVAAPLRRIDEVVDAVGLGEQAGQVAGTPSGGQLARASLASALLGRPDVLVLDEPTVGVDPVLRRDPRTLALLFVIPPALLTLMRYVLDGQPLALARVAPPMIGLFPLITMFLVTSITMLRERTTGTLERLMTLPLAKVDLLAGYALTFGLVGAIQAVIVVVVALGPLGVDVAGSPVLVGALGVGNALLGMALGLFVSAFAATEFQAVQFLPALIFPQLLLCGLFVPREQMSSLLESISWAMPMTYAFDALAGVAREGSGADGLARDVLVLAGFTLAAVAAGAATLSRRTD